MRMAMGETDWHDDSLTLRVGFSRTTAAKRRMRNWRSFNLCPNMSKPPLRERHTTFKNVKDIEAHARTRMEKVLADFQHEDRCTSGPAAPTIGLLDSVRVDYYGTPVAAQSGGATARPRAGHDHRSALGYVDDRRRLRKRSAAPTWG